MATQTDFDPTNPIEQTNGRPANILAGPSRDGMYFVELQDEFGGWYSDTYRVAELALFARNLDPSRLTIEVDGVKEEVRLLDVGSYAEIVTSAMSFRTSDGIEAIVSSNSVQSHPLSSCYVPITAPRPWLTDAVKQRIGQFIRDERKRRKAKADYSKLTTPAGRVCEMVNLDNGIDADPCWARIGGRVLCVGKHSVTCDDEDGLENAKPNAWPFPPETGARIDALLDDIEAKEKPVDHSRVTIAGREGRVWEIRNPGTSDGWHVQIGRQFWCVWRDGDVQMMFQADAPHEIMANPATRPLPESAKAKIAEMLQPAAPAVDWKAHADSARRVSEEAMSLNTRDLAATVAALCDAMAKGGAK